VPSLDPSSERTTHAFLNMVFSWFRIPFKIFIHQGMEFHREFQKLCEKTLVYYRTPQMNGSNGEMKFA
jgi:hypothetical protein